MIEQKPNKVFLYSGLSVLILAFFCKWIEMPTYSFWVLLGIAIVLKTIFLISAFRTKYKPSKGFFLILTGVGMILISMVFKYIYPIALLGKIFFYIAIILKITGLIMMIRYNGNYMKKTF